MRGIWRRWRQEMKLALVEVYEVASFYAHFDIVLDGETPPPPLTVRVCDSLTCEMFGAQALLKELPGKLGAQTRVRARAPAWAAATTPRSPPSATRCMNMPASTAW